MLPTPQYSNYEPELNLKTLQIEGNVLPGFSPADFPTPQIERKPGQSATSQVGKDALPPADFPTPQIERKPGQSAASQVGKEGLPPLNFEGDRTRITEL
jgi:hypothetical protein